jgi:general stress protein YciG
MRVLMAKRKRRRHSLTPTGREGQGPFKDDRELAVRAGRKGGSVKRKRTFDTQPGLAARAAKLAQLHRRINEGKYPPKPQINRFTWKY